MNLEHVNHKSGALSPTLAPPRLKINRSPDLRRRRDIIERPIDTWCATCVVDMSGSSNSRSLRCTIARLRDGCYQRRKWRISWARQPSASLVFAFLSPFSPPAGTPFPHRRGLLRGLCARQSSPFSSFSLSAFSPRCKHGGGRKNSLRPEFLCQGPHSRASRTILLNSLPNVPACIRSSNENSRDARPWAGSSLLSPSPRYSPRDRGMTTARMQKAGYCGHRRCFWGWNTC